MKRALTTFGNPFGLALYDPELRGYAAASAGFPTVMPSPGWSSHLTGGYSPPTAIPSTFAQPSSARSRQVEDPRALKALWARHAAALEMLRWNVPDLTNEEGIHRGSARLLQPAP